MTLSNIHNLNDLKEFANSLENIHCGFRTPYFTTDKYAYIKLKSIIIEYPEFPIDTVFNRIVISSPNSIQYFSITFESQKGISPKIFRKRTKFKDNWQPIKDSFAENDFFFNSNLNYDSPFYSLTDPFNFLLEWINTVFSEETIRFFLDKRKFHGILNEYQTVFKENENDTWKNSSGALRIEEVRNDIRIVLCIDPYDFHPTVTFASLEQYGIAPPVISLFNSWFSYEKLIRLTKKIDFSFHETVQFEKYPDILKNEQIFTLNATPLNIDGRDMVDVVMKGARNQVRFHKEYFLQLLDIYPLDLQNRGDFEGEEAVTHELYGKKIKYFNGSRIYIKPEFDLMILFFPEIVKDENGVEYLEFHFNMRYRPYIKSREQEVKWTWHHLLEDLGK